MGEEPKQLDSKWKQEYRNDVVYLHVISRSMAGSIVNLSPFALKLEAWLRINKIPFEVISDFPPKFIINAKTLILMK